MGLTAKKLPCERYKYMYISPAKVNRPHHNLWKMYSHVLRRDSDLPFYFKVAPTTFPHCRCVGCAQVTRNPCPQASHSSSDAWLPCVLFPGVFSASRRRASGALTHPWMLVSKPRLCQSFIPQETCSVTNHEGDTPSHLATSSFCRNPESIPTTFPHL